MGRRNDPIGFKERLEDTIANKIDRERERRNGRSQDKIGNVDSKREYKIWAAQRINLNYRRKNHGGPKIRGKL